ncbi:unnamed protein product [Leuciscus chuanchicus]
MNENTLKTFCLTYSSEASTHLIDQAVYGMFALIGMQVLALIKGPQACVGSSLDSIDSPRCSSPTLALCQLYVLINDRRILVHTCQAQRWASVNRVRLPAVVLPDRA